ncbi:putative protein TPRXL isoform X1 [Silurus meridionalis]|uniref:putative protein TPRXL isoform X1 n=1 Tax=Silurus meridionalis TaxID=175797 RepID=UPI001EEC9306|nr:putative protein TPRXL isoform X1 [Silurus meridionalis]
MISLMLCSILLLLTVIKRILEFSDGQKRFLLFLVEFQGRLELGDVLETQEDGDRTRHQSPPSSSSPVRTRSPLSSSSPVRTQSPPSHLSPVRTQFLPSSSSPVRTRSPPSSSSPVRTQSPPSSSSSVRTQSPPKKKVSSHSFLFSISPQDWGYQRFL